MLRWLAVVLASGIAVLASGGVALAAPKPPTPAPFTLQPYGQAEVVALAQKVFDDAFDDVKKKDEWKAAHAGGDTSAKGALKLSSLGAQQIALGKLDGVLLVAQAAIASPDDPLIATNFGIALSRLSRRRDALRVQLYARELAPRMPVVLTNLGVAYSALGDNALAKTNLRRATLWDRLYCPAWTSLAIVYANEGNVRDAVGAYLQSFPCSKIRKHKSKLRSAPPPPPPEPPKKGDSAGPGAAGGDGAGGEAEAARKRRGEELRFRPFPTWSTVEAFMGATTGMEQWSKKLGAILRAAQDDMDPAAIAQAARRGRSASGPDGDVGVAIDVLSRQYTKATADLSDRHRREVDAIDKQLAAQLKESAKRMEPALRTADRKLILAAKNQYCADARNLQGTAFVKWRELERKHYDATCDLLRDLWAQGSEWLGYVEDPGERRFYQGVLESEIWSKLAPLPQVYVYRAAMYAAQRLTAVGECAKGDEVLPTPPAAPEERPPPATSNCPVPKGSEWSRSASAAGYTCSLTLADDCKTVKAECRTGVGPKSSPFGVKAGAQWDGRSGNVSVFAGSYVTGKTATGGTHTFENTLEATFDRDGNFEKATMVTGKSSTGDAASTKGWNDRVVFVLFEAPEEN